MLLLVSVNQFQKHRLSSIKISDKKKISPFCSAMERFCSYFVLLEAICYIFPIGKLCAYVFFCLDKCYPVNEHNKTSVYLNAIKKKKKLTDIRNQ